MNGMKHISIVFVMMVAMLLSLTFVTAGVVSSDAIDIDKVEIEDEEISVNAVNRFDFERGQELEIEIKLTANDFLDDVEVTGFITGYEFNRIEPMSDTTRPFDMDPNVTYFKKLHIYLPIEAEEDDYKFRLLVSDRYGDTIVQEYNLRIDSPRHGFQIEDVVFSPGSVVQAGRALLTTVRVENKGENDEDSVKVTVAIPELGVTASDFIDEVEFEDSETSEELYLRIPQCAQEGDYVAIIEVRYNELREAITEEAIVSVVADESCPGFGGSSSGAHEPKTVLTVGTNAQDLEVGKAGAIYPVTLTNEGSASKTYTVSVEGTNNFASVQVNPLSTFVLDGGETQTVYLYLTALEGASEGAHVFTASIISGDTILKQIPLTANVVGANEEETEKDSSSDLGGLRRGLEIALIVLVVILVILGLVIGFNKLKGDDDDDDEYQDEADGRQTYY